MGPLGYHVDPDAERHAHAERTGRVEQLCLLPVSGFHWHECGFARQLVRIALLSISTHTHRPLGRVWLNELSYPLYATALSVVVLLIQLIIRVWAKKASDEQPTQHLSLGERFQKHLDGIGGRTIFTFRLARLLVNVVLVGLSGYTVLRQKYNHDEPGAFLLQSCLLVAYVRPSFLFR